MTTVFVLCLLLVGSPLVEGNEAGFLSAESVENKLQEAMETALGMAASSLPSITKALMPIFNVLPKNAHGRIERPMLRYALHRYFLRQYSVMVQGLEPTQNMLDATALVTSEGIYRDKIPTFIEGVLEGRFFKKGFALEDAAAIAAVLEELVFQVPDKAFEHAPKRRRSLSRIELETLLEGYVLQWMLGDETDVQEVAMSSPEESIPQWKAVIDFAKGEIDRLMYHRQQAGYGNAFKSRVFTLADFQTIVKSITSGFGVWWEQECQAIKKNLISMDSTNSGRVRLSDFYHKSIDGEWRFSESEEYLRELGVLDESSRMAGPQVILPNYLLGASNCIVTSTYYHVCCVNECEALLGEVEQAVKAPVGRPDEVFKAVLNMTEEEEDRLRFFGHLQKQLDRIADAHKGKVPLHGRLFGQWMHRAFPRECPFPHRAGSTQAKAPLEFGEKYLVTPTEIKKHTKAAKERHSASPDASLDGFWASELNALDEELLTEYVEFGGSGLWAKVRSVLLGGPTPVLASAVLFFLLSIALQDKFGGGKNEPMLIPRQKLFV
jgi:hypothetical protein